MSSVLYDVAGPKARRRYFIGSLIGIAVLLAILGLAIWRLAANDQFEADKWSPFIEEPELWSQLFDALIFGTLKAAGYALVLALVLGTVLAVGRLSHSAVVRMPATLIIEFFRTVPLLLLIFFFYLGFPLAFGINLPALWTVVLGLMLYNGAVIAEIIRAGVLALPKGQTEAALGIGMTRGQAMRSVLLPQAFRIMLPALISQLVVLLKDTSLGFIVSYGELLRRSNQLAILLDNPVQLLLVTAGLYIIVNLALSRLAVFVEARQRAKISGKPLAPKTNTMEQGGAPAEGA